MKTLVCEQHVTNRYAIYNADCVDVVSALPSDSVGFSVFSPPFASLYTYSASERDMGNCKTHGEFMEHFGFLVKELLRVTKPGRLLSFHCMNLPTSKTRDGYIGIADFRGGGDSSLSRCGVDLSLRGDDLERPGASHAAH